MIIVICNIQGVSQLLSFLFFLLICWILLRGRKIILIIKVKTSSYFLIHFQNSCAYHVAKFLNCSKLSQLLQLVSFHHLSIIFNHLSIIINGLLSASASGLCSGQVQEDCLQSFSYHKIITNWWDILLKIIPPIPLVLLQIFLQACNKTR